MKFQLDFCIVLICFIFILGSHQARIKVGNILFNNWPTNPLNERTIEQKIGFLIKKYESISLLKKKPDNHRVKQFIDYLEKFFRGGDISLNNRREGNRSCTEFFKINKRDKLHQIKAAKPVAPKLSEETEETLLTSESEDDNIVNDPDFTTDNQQKKIKLDVDIVAALDRSKSSNSNGSNLIEGLYSKKLMVFEKINNYLLFCFYYHFF